MKPKIAIGFPLERQETIPGVPFTVTGSLRSILPGTDRWNALPATEQKTIYADYAEINKVPGNAPGLPLGLPAAAKTVQVRDGKANVKDGTYLPEGVAGYTVFEADSMEAAVELASRIPAARLGGAVEIRPAAKYW